VLGVFHRFLSFKRTASCSRPDGGAERLGRSSWVPAKRLFTRSGASSRDCLHRLSIDKWPFRRFRFIA